MCSCRYRDTHRSRTDHVFFFHLWNLCPSFFSSESVEEVRKGKSTEMPAESPFWECFWLFPGVECQGQWFCTFKKRLEQLAQVCIQQFQLPQDLLVFVAISLRLWLQWQVSPRPTMRDGFLPLVSYQLDSIFLLPCRNSYTFLVHWQHLFLFPNMNLLFLLISFPPDRILVRSEVNFCVLGLHVKLGILSITFCPFDFGQGFSQFWDSVYFSENGNDSNISPAYLPGIGKGWRDTGVIYEQKKQHKLSCY